MSQEIKLYDLPSRGRCQSWSANTWRTRLILNYKNIPYQTVWVPYTKIDEVLPKTGVAPSGNSQYPYGTPTLVLPSGEALSDGNLTTLSTLAPRLEQLYPTPPLPNDPALNTATLTAITETIGPLIPYFMPLVGRNIIVDEDQSWFQRNREVYFGLPLDEVEASPAAGDQAWSDARPGFVKLCALLREHKRDAGPFVLGSQVCYADFWILATIHMFKVIGDEPGRRFESQGPELKVLYDAGKPWLERDD